MHWYILLRTPYNNSNWHRPSITCTDRGPENRAVLCKFWRRRCEISSCFFYSQLRRHVVLFWIIRILQGLKGCTKSLLSFHKSVTVLVILKPNAAAKLVAQMLSSQYVSSGVLTKDFYRPPQLIQINFHCYFLEQFHFNFFRFSVILSMWS